MEEQNIGKEMADCFDKVVDKITKSSEDKCCYCKDTGFIPNNNTSEFDERPCVSCWVGQNIIKGLSPAEHPDVQRLIGQVVELQAENTKLKEENRTAASIIKRFLVIAEALKGGCWK